MTVLFSDAILAWFDEEARPLPWRAESNRVAGGYKRDPYAVVVSEFMLQQTQVITVIPYYERFMKRFPTFRSLAVADETEVLKYWEGLGYYRRAKQLLALAIKIVDEYNCFLPQDRTELMKLPGIGPYTAGAILSFAYDLPEPAVDGNVVRVFARLNAKPYVQGDVKAQREVRSRVLGMMPSVRAGDFSEALIELGATVCVSSAPDCAICPVNEFCEAFAFSVVGGYPVPAKALAKPVSRLSYVLLFDEQHVFCRRRPSGLLSGLYEFLSFPEKIEEGNTARIEELIKRWISEKGEGVVRDISYAGNKRSVFSHRIWEISCWEVGVSCLKAIDPSLIVRESHKTDSREGSMVAPEELAELPFPAFLIPWRDNFISRSSCAPYET